MPLLALQTGLVKVRNRANETKWRLVVLETIIGDDLMMIGIETRSDQEIGPVPNVENLKEVQVTVTIVEVVVVCEIGQTIDVMIDGMIGTRPIEPVAAIGAKRMEEGTEGVEMEVVEMEVIDTAVVGMTIEIAVIEMTENSTIGRHGRMTGRASMNGDLNLVVDSIEMRMGLKV